MGRSYKEGEDTDTILAHTGETGRGNKITMESKLHFPQKKSVKTSSGAWTAQKHHAQTPVKSREASAQRSLLLLQCNRLLGLFTSPIIRSWAASPSPALPCSPWLFVPPEPLFLLLNWVLLWREVSSGLSQPLGCVPAWLFPGCSRTSQGAAEFPLSSMKLFR